MFDRCGLWVRHNLERKSVDRDVAGRRTGVESTCSGSAWHCTINFAGMSFAALPDELLPTVFSRLSPGDLLQLSLVRQVGPKLVSLEDF